jgi:hypothetical protein
MTQGEDMKICYCSYLEFVLKADVLTRELILTPKEAAELLAKVSGYEDHSTMPVGQPIDSLPPSRAELIHRLLTLRPDISPHRAADVITKLGFPAENDMQESDSTDRVKGSNEQNLRAARVCQSGKGFP